MFSNDNKVSRLVYLLDIETCKGTGQPLKAFVNTFGKSVHIEYPMVYNTM